MSLTFDEVQHKYYYNGKEIKQSVTQFIHRFFSDFDINEIFDKNYDNWQRNKNSQYYNKTKDEILKIWKHEQELGTLLHETIEKYFKNEEFNVDKSIETEWIYFLQYCEQNLCGLTPFKSEMRVYDSELDLAGSIDMLFKDENGDIVLVDWKRTKRITQNSYGSFAKPPIQQIPDSNFWHYTLQLNMYKYILEKNYNLKIKEMYLVQLHPNYGSYIKHEISGCQDIIQTLISYSNGEN